MGAFRSYHSVGLLAHRVISCVQCTFSSGLSGPVIITEATAGFQDSFQAERRCDTYADVPQLDGGIEIIERCCSDNKPAKSLTRETEVRRVDLERTRRGKETG